MSKLICVSLIFLCIKIAQPIKCYQCNTTDSTNPFQCGEWFERFDQPDIEPQDCSSVHGANYCIKHIGRFEVSCIKCYQCSAAESLSCSNLIINMPDSPLQPESCDHVIDAKYCIKSTALNGGIGAKRFCSSKNLGDYCEYVKQKGDVMEYRSCYYTCSTDGCNNSSIISIDKKLSAILVIFFLIVGKKIFFK